MIYETFGPLDKLICGWKAGVRVKRSFIRPAGMKPKQPRVLYGAVGLDGDTSRFDSNARNSIPQLGSHRFLFPFNGDCRAWATSAIINRPVKSRTVPVAPDSRLERLIRVALKAPNLMTRILLLLQCSHFLQ